MILSEPCLTFTVVIALCLSDEPSGPIVGNCAHTWRSQSNSTHEVTWQYDSTTDSVQFTLKARLAQRQWIGVGISRDTFMVCTKELS